MPWKLKEFVCERCGHPFTAPKLRARFCGLACAGVVRGGTRPDINGSGNGRWAGGLIEKKCTVCDVTYRVKRKCEASTKYCSRRCQNRAIAKAKAGMPGARMARGPESPLWKGGPPEWTCEQCKNRYRRHVGKREVSRFCSRACQNAFLAAANRRVLPPGFAVPFRRLRQWLRNSFEYREWRAAVYRRDHDACVRCGATDRLTAHHVKQLVTHPELAFDVANGLTVCESCHRDIHTVEGRARGTAKLVTWMIEQGWTVDATQPPLYQHVCDECGSPFNSPRARQLRCSEACHRRHHNRLANEARKATRAPSAGPAENIDIPFDPPSVLP